MLHKRYKIAILILVCIMLFNFITIPKQKAESAAVALEGGKALLLLLLAALGITVASQSDLEGLYGQMDWDSMIMNSNIDLSKYTKPQGEPPDYDALMKALLMGGTSLAIGFSGLLDDIKEWLQGIGATEGENDILSDGLSQTIDLNGKIFNFRVSPKDVAGQTYKTYQYFVNYKGIDYSCGGPSALEFKKARFEIESLIGNQLKVKSYGDYINTSGQERINWLTQHTIYLQTSTNPENEPINSNPIKYYVRSNSSVITDIPPAYIPQPDIGVLPNIQETITPEGEKKYIYPGTMDDLLNDMKNNTSWQDLLGSINNYQDGFSTPYTLTETQQGVEIDYGTTTEVPFPETGEEPDPENTTTGLGRIIALLKSIINWLFRLWEIPKLLFEIPEGLEIDTSKLRLNNFQLKFPFSIPWDIAKAITVFSASPVDPDLVIDIDTDNLKVNHRIDLSYIDLPLRFARYAASIFFILYLANKTRDLIKW